MGKRLGATGFFLIGLALVGAGIGAFFAGKPELAVILFVAAGCATTALCSFHKEG